MSTVKLYDPDKPGCASWAGHGVGVGAGAAGRLLGDGGGQDPLDEAVQGAQQRQTLGAVVGGQARGRGPLRVF